VTLSAEEELVLRAVLRESGGTVASAARGDFQLTSDLDLAARAVARVNQETGSTIPLAAVLEAPTVARFAQRMKLESLAALRDSTAASASSPVEWYRNGGTLPTFVVVDSGDRAGGAFEELVAALEPDRSACIVRGAEGVDVDKLWPVVVGLAQQARGRLVLAGHGAGAVAAFALSHRLGDLGDCFPRVLAVEPRPLTGTTAGFRSEVCCVVAQRSTAASDPGWRSLWAALTVCRLPGSEVECLTGTNATRVAGLVAALGG
jgi:hypothetical protein